MEKQKFEFKQSQIDLLNEWKEKSLCYKFMLDKTFTYYSTWDERISIPLMLMTFFIGSLQTAQDSFSSETIKVIIFICGGFNIIRGVLDLLKKYYKFDTKLVNADINRAGYSKLVNRIKTQFAKDPEDRIPIENFIDSIEQEFNRLYETNPPIPQIVINELNDKINLLNIQKPNICDTVDIPTTQNNNTVETFKKNYVAIFEEEPSVEILNKAINNNLTKMSADTILYRTLP